MQIDVAGALAERLEAMRGMIRRLGGEPADLIDVVAWGLAVYESLLEEAHRGRDTCVCMAEGVLRPVELFPGQRATCQANFWPSLD